MSRLDAVIFDSSEFDDLHAGKGTNDSACAGKWGKRTLFLGGVEIRHNSKRNFHVKTKI